MCKRCGCWFVFGVGSYSEPRGGTVLGHCAEGGLCWQCVDVLKQRRKTKYKKGWTQGMLDRLQQEEDMLDKLEEEKENEEQGVQSRGRRGSRRRRRFWDWIALEQAAEEMHACRQRG